MATIHYFAYGAVIALSLLFEAGHAELPQLERVSLSNGAAECPMASELMWHNGSCNNRGAKDQGAAKQPFKLLFHLSTRNPTSINLPSARLVSNIICNEDKTTLNARRMTEFWTFFGQFLDHTFAETHLGNDSMNIPIPANDKFFPPGGELPFKRTIKLPTPRGLSPENVLSSYIDASTVYGTESKLVSELKTGEHGKLKMSAGMLLPKHTEKGKIQFLAGDARANENPALAALHTLFVREHNRVCDELIATIPEYKTSDQIYKAARSIVVAETQAIVFDEFLPAILGKKLAPYPGYDKWTDGALSSEFATSIFRVGHTLINPEFTLFTREGKKFTRQLRDTFFKIEVIENDGIEGVLRGVMNSRAAEVDVSISNAVRNFLTLNTPMKVDLAALNIQRGRDHAVPSYNQLRRNYGLKPRKFFWEITKNEDLARRLHLVYAGDIEKIDPWVGGLAEDHQKPGSLGELFTRAWTQEFTRLRNGNRFYFESSGYFSSDQSKVTTVKHILKEKGVGGTMRRIILANTKLTSDQVPPNPFIDSDYL